MINLNQILSLMGGNPSSFLQSQLQQNPQARQIQTQLQNMQKSSGMSSKDFALQYARQNGIDVNALQQFANRLGLK